MLFNILVTKETRANELRVALIPADVEKLIHKGHQIFIEQNAGQAAGFSDQDYENVGAIIRYLPNETLESYKALFKDIQVIVRAKRPSRTRELLENKAIAPNTIMIGALDPLEKDSSHIAEYHAADIVAYSIDQLNLPPEHLMNVLAAMSKMAGKLALQDALKKSVLIMPKIVIIGFGIVGRSAFAEALNQNLPVTVVLSNVEQGEEIKTCGGNAVLLDRNLNLIAQQAFIKTILIESDIVISSARSANQPAPLLIPLTTLNSMKPNSVVVDMALSEGGNVEGSEHDATYRLGNQVMVTNVSGYPKALPQESSILWSRASFHFINLLAEGSPIPLQPC